MAFTLSSRASCTFTRTTTAFPRSNTLKLSLAPRFNKFAVPKRFFADHAEKPARKPGVQYWSYAEIADHCYGDDAWLVIHGKVYNVTSWVPRHPGGNVILARAGKDATDIFERLGHSTYAQEQLASMYIGECTDAARYTAVAPDGLPWTMRSDTGIAAEREKHPRKFDYRMDDDGVTREEKRKDEHH